MTVAMLLTVLCLLFRSFAFAGIPPSSSDTFPIVDLGYAKHAPTKVNYTTTHNISYATYSNIRFAQPPLGDLRFRAPLTPPPVETEVQDGDVPLNSTNCLQAIPYYFPLPGHNGTWWGSEDCLFLDVIVPVGVKYGDNVPVLHWLYGGGFFFGAKDTGGNPAALFNNMTIDEKFIIVASNYRLGPMGFMSSGEEPSIAPNIGLHDALAALEWTRDNIHRFGGDGQSVTVMGQSAGGGMIEHFLAASVEGIVTPFSQAILSSPGYRPHVNRSLEMTEIYHTFLTLTNCSDVRCLRALDTASIIEANRHMLLDLPTDGFPGPDISFGPIIDGYLVRDVPERVLSRSTVNATTGHIKRVIAGGMKNDGAASTIGDYTSWASQLSIFARHPSAPTINEIQSLYGSFTGRTSSFFPNGSISLTPFDDFSGDVIYACHSLTAAKMYARSGPEGVFWAAKDKEKGEGSASGCSSSASSSYRYEMSISPALHAQDMDYYFYDEVVAETAPETKVEVARVFQDYLRRFILGLEMDGWPEYSSEGGGDRPIWMNVILDGFEVVAGEDEADLAKKCEALVGLLSDPADGW